MNHQPENRCLDRGDAAVLVVHQPLLRSIARRWVPSRDTEDVVQETFLRALGADCLPQDSGRLRRLLAVIARNVCTDWHRRRERRRSEPLLDGEPGTADPTLERSVIEDELAVRLRAVRPEHRRLLTAFHVEGASLSQIADQLGVSVGAAAQRLHRLRRTVRMAN